MKKYQVNCLIEQTVLLSKLVEANDEKEALILSLQNSNKSDWKSKKTTKSKC